MLELKADPVICPLSIIGRQTYSNFAFESGSEYHKPGVFSCFDKAKLPSRHITYNQIHNKNKNEIN